MMDTVSTKNPHLAFKIVPVKGDKTKLQEYIDKVNESPKCSPDKVCSLKHVDKAGECVNYEAGAHMCFIKVSLILKLIYSTTKMSNSIIAEGIIVPSWHNEILQGLTKINPLISYFDIESFRGKDAIIRLTKLFKEDANTYIIGNLFKENTYTVKTPRGEITRHDVMDIQLPRGSIIDLDKDIEHNSVIDLINYNDPWLIYSYACAIREFGEECDHVIDHTYFKLSDASIIRDYGPQGRRGIMWIHNHTLTLLTLYSITKFRNTCIED